MSKRGQMKKKSLEEEQQAIGAIYKQYIDTFQANAEVPRKVFVKSDTLYAEGKEDPERGQLYIPKPITKLKKDVPTIQKRQPQVNAPPFSSNKRSEKKSNLKALGDELKMLQQERQAKEIKLVLSKMEPTIALSTPENDYSTSTNLFVSNLSPQVTESHLIQLFGTYGPLASVKIMWPRNEINSRSANCGFVAYMSRVDAERAMIGLQNHKDMRINWGKPVKIPTHPVYIPPELLELYSPPPPSGLPFNAQTKIDINELNDLSSTIIKVTIPFDRNILMIIHRMIEFVIREGPEFETMIMNKESANPDYSFLYDFQHPAHTYYRWKLYSMLNGDPKNSWSMKPFRMYKDGSIWIPPTAPDYKTGMPKELIKIHNMNVRLSETQVLRLISLIRNLTSSRSSIAEAMTFCLNHSNAINDIMEILLDSFKNSTTNPLKKIARLYLLSDILFNCKFQKICCETFSPDSCTDVFNELHNTFNELHHLQDKICFKAKVSLVLKAWVSHNLYDVKFITKLENILLAGNENGEDDDSSLNDEPLDGASLLKRSYQTASTDCLIVDKKQISTKTGFVDMFTHFDH